MGYRCINPMGASPCISDTRFARDNKGNLLFSNGTGISGRVERRNRFVAFDKVVAFVDFASRKYFEPTDEATRRQDEKDKQWLIRELEAIGADLPENPTLSELGAAYDRFDPRMRIISDKRMQKRDRRIGLKKGVTPPGVDENAEVSERENIIKQLNAFGLKFNPKDKTEKLKKQLSAEIDRRTSLDDDPPDGESGE